MLEGLDWAEIDAAEKAACVQTSQDDVKIEVDAHGRTSLAGVYAGGDCVAPGDDLTVQAVQHGKVAAAAIHADLCTGKSSKTEMKNG